MSETTNTHFGIYGVCFNEEKLLCIRKNAGPYQNRYDLPGGSQMAYEGLTQTLVRECLEETGYQVIHYSNPRMYDAFVKEEASTHTVHHIMAFYDVSFDFNSFSKEFPTFLEDGRNDSDGIAWLTLNQLNEENASPLILKLKQEITGTNALNKSIFQNWQVK